MNRNELIGTVISTSLGYMVQGAVFSTIAEAINPQSALLIRTGTKYGIKLIKYTAKNYARADFKSETIFSDAIDASFFAD